MRTTVLVCDRCRTKCGELTQVNFFKAIGRTRACEICNACLDEFYHVFLGRKDTL